MKKHFLIFLIPTLPLLVIINDALHGYPRELAYLPIFFAIYFIIFFHYLKKFLKSKFFKSKE